MTDSPTLLNLSQALNLDIGHAYEKTLCENIFDVSRTDLLDTYERLRLSFWSDNTQDISSPSSPPLEGPSLSEPVSQSPTLPRKRHVSEPVLEKTTVSRRQDTKLTRPPPPPQQHDYSASAVSPNLHTLWGWKKAFIRELRMEKPNYNEERLLELANECGRRCDSKQRKHLAKYLSGITKALRLEDRFTSKLEEWL
ncbi:hypothetical protein O0I10_010960 [Lichtheimia ornata]|uniref:Uncharacterized protein n=1 Tax=Lichtheimia ornata TaxID=688661 RepID=A0AAD7UV90_9FUNG|nr:uncharacterized protein O0I10_010960 [Lichtheimia ornata]KAJ8653414.1 hypothetical protein O0I10_010960 [Lichtheimia ornata]